MSIFTSVVSLITRTSKDQRLGRAPKAMRHTPSATMFESLESRTHLDASTPEPSFHVPFAEPPASIFTLHPGATSLFSAAGESSQKPFPLAVAGGFHAGGASHSSTSSHRDPGGRVFAGSVDWRAEGRALDGVYLRTSDSDTAMRPRRPNLVPAIGSTPSSGAAEHQPEKSPALPPPAAATRVLVIEDDALARKAIATALRGHGFNVAVAGTMQEGLRELSARPDHVLLDLTLPDGDGEQVLHRICSLRLRTRVTITSGSSDADRLSHARELGANDVLNKPMNMNALVHHLLSAAA